MTTPPSPCFVAFHITSADRFQALCAAFAAIKHDKDTGEWRAEEDWLAVFDDEALAHFWWPTKQELEAHWARWESAPIPGRLYDPELEPPSWDFLSMIEVFKNGEYDLLTCRQMDDGNGHLEFAPHAWPYGGTGCLRMLVRACGFAVTGEDDGSGYRRL